MSVIFDPSKYEQYGYARSIDDGRDYNYRVMMGVNQNMPEEFFCEPTDIENQGDKGTCAAFAGTAVKEEQEKKNHPGKNYKFSKAQLYSQAKKVDGIPKTPGTYLKTILDILHKKGVCKESTFPYHLLTSDTNVLNIPESTWEEAKQFLIAAYARVYTVQEMKQALVEQGSLLCGLLVTESFKYCGADGTIPMPEGYLLGGHGVKVDGFSDKMERKIKGVYEKGFFRLHNSWDKTWGDNGYGWLPYRFITYRLQDLPGLSFFDESWSSLDVILPNPAAEKMVLWIGRDKAIVDGETILLDNVPTINNGRTNVPLRFIAENFNCQVDWEPVEKKITITRR
ncbi:C1 family peptidase [Geosporobacter ferrireducens]|uniref:C1 family peptidase n=1 Tax=Geosporobacter ferrireducens TaxID=1424294 RepID=UPI0023564B9A|nr:C1 family peptidase [Geosporobacter ferrireducens]